MGEDSARPKKCPGDGDRDRGLLGVLMDKGVRKQQTGPNIHCWDLHAANFIVQQLAQQLPVAASSLHDQRSKEIKTCHVDILCYEGDARGWPPPGPMTLDAEHVFST